ncbi:hypothetical protein CCAX7_39890 [Capsulimonas corticalis]|uniref:Alpha-L-rhamnosidase six-hairpin glycosidase domain-containing protein n=1 Tax=Capsulimonas corticalis TaxID=2219043 RepID=A0A9N7L6U2_9BACT|nr:hypothetical protein CCAX7_39890 [Capsulimonas corticalis]
MIAVLGAALAFLEGAAHAGGQGAVRQDADRKVVTMTDGQGDLSLRLRYDGKCMLDQITVRGRQVAGADGVADGVRIDGQWYTTRTGGASPNVAAGKNTLTVRGIVYGKPDFQVRETWYFKTKPDGIEWTIQRRYPTAATLQDTGFPEWNFAAIDTWKGGVLGNGGVVWNKYLASNDATYGAHTSAVTFWNPDANDCLRITPTLPPGYQGAVRFSHQRSGQQSMHFSVSKEELKPNHELRRYLPDRGDLWAPFQVSPGEVRVTLTLQAPSYRDAYDRGTFRGVDGDGIRELMNTVSRYGVIDTHLTGGNGWLSGYICLHEQWYGQIALALADPNYTANLAATLNFERDHAIGADGRVKSRWTYDAGDAMPGTYDEYGFYEAQWGYLMDSQTDYVIDAAELYDLTGDTPWLAGQKATCEKALDYLIRREVGNTGLAAMRTDSEREHQGSDWLDIVWASYENALVNAEMYYALTHWADAEDALGDTQKASSYRAFAARLKSAFNKPIGEGGFWDPANQWYVYWRDKDGSAHGDNLVTPVNFSAIAYGLCDDPARRKAILDRTEAEMRKEKLFFWPLTFSSFLPEEAASSNFPFPTYENGDIFMSWGEVGVRAYAAYDPALALKYVQQTLARYAKDGLSCQRYLRGSQEGAGDDILAGNCMTIVGLYRDIYGVQPKPNRLYLEPHLSRELNGTQLRYLLRGQKYVIDLNTNGSAITANNCTIRDTSPFAVNAANNSLEYFPGQSKEWALSVTPAKGQRVTIQIASWPTDANAPRRWTELGSGKGKAAYVVAHLMPNTVYEWKIGGKAAGRLRSDGAGSLRFATAWDGVAREVEVGRPIPCKPTPALRATPPATGRVIRIDIAGSLRKSVSCKPFPSREGWREAPGWVCKGWGAP